jgi:LysM repeat protein
MSRQSRIAAQKRNEFQQLQQVNRLYAQKLQQGLSPAQAATSQQVTLTSGQTLDSLAAKNGVGVTDILNANPDMTAPKTGMVLNIPNNYNPAQRGRGFAFQDSRTKDDTYGGGLPSNAALGGLTNNAVNQVPTNYNQAQRGRGFGQPAPVSPLSQPFGSLNQKLPYNPAFGPGQYNSPAFPTTVGGTPSPYQPAQNIVPFPNAQAQTSAAAIKTAGTAFAPTFRTKDDYYPTELAARVSLLGMKPTQDQLNYLEKYGKIVKTPQPAFASSGGGRRRGGRGGGSGAGTGTGKTPRVQTQQEPRLPAFSSGGGFNGLVNWRI